MYDEKGTTKGIIMLIQEVIQKLITAGYKPISQKFWEKKTDHDSRTVCITQTVIVFAIIENDPKEG